MNSEEKHYELEIQDLIDGRLDPGNRAEVESHIAKCDKCRAEFEWLSRTKQIVQKEIQTVQTPDIVKSKILQSLKIEPSKEIRYRKFWLRPKYLAAAVLIILFIFAAIVYRNTGSSRIPSQVAKDYRSYISSDLNLKIISSKPEEIENFFRQNKIPFKTRVFDLAMMGYRLRGGKVHQLAGRPSAFFVYQGPNQETMICQMFPGSVGKLPTPSETRNHNGIRFLIYQENEITLVFWQEAEIVCVLASNAKKEDVIQLAFAKAVKI
ncbi:zf-HC2 domain-containing protein [bacterium]|nr:zf-HC2 domain-containing protein [bacterium]MCI0612454.1 zf-HC2 domain-containing protein [bacterium]